MGDITERKWAEQRLLRYQEQLRSLATELALSEERERRKIAQALHDRIGQVLALVNIKLGALRKITPTGVENPLYRRPGVVMLLGDARETVSRLTQEISRGLQKPV